MLRPFLFLYLDNFNSCLVHFNGNDAGIWKERGILFLEI